MSCSAVHWTCCPNTRLKFDTGLWRGPQAAQLMEEILSDILAVGGVHKYMLEAKKTKKKTTYCKAVVLPWFMQLSVSICWIYVGLPWHHLLHIELTHWAFNLQTVIKKRHWQEIKYLIVKCLFKSVPRTTLYHILQTSGIHTKKDKLGEKFTEKHTGWQTYIS